MYLNKEVCNLKFPDDGVTVPKHVGAVLMYILM